MGCHKPQIQFQVLGTDHMIINIYECICEVFTRTSIFLVANSHGMQILSASNNVKKEQQKHIKHEIDNSFYQYSLHTKLLSTEFYSLLDTK